MDALHTDELKESFTQKDAFNIQDIGSFYESLEPDVPKSTVNWRIYKLVERGIIQRVGRGKYQIGGSSFFEPGITRKMIQVNRYMKKQFPYIKYIVWHIGDINTFSQHLFNKDITFVEVERDSVESITEQLRDKFKYVQDSRAPSYLYPNESVIMVRPYTGSGTDDMDSGLLLGISEEVEIDLCDEKLVDLAAVAAQRPSRRPVVGYHDRLEEVASMNLERLKVDGDWEVLPSVVCDFAMGKYAMSEDGKQLYYRIGSKFHPVRTVLMEGNAREAIFNAEKI